MTTSLLNDWTTDDFHSLEKGVLLAKHRLAETGLFTDEALIKILDTHPAECLHINTMGYDSNKFEWRAGDRNGVASDVLLKTVKNGHLWINCRNMLDHHRLMPERSIRSMMSWKPAAPASLLTIARQIY